MSERDLFHPCAAVGCQRRIEQRLLMCMEHWRLVPAPLAREVRALAWARRDKREPWPQEDES